ncbi:ribonuclease [Peptoniphilus asaccharolyticus DSM 20463]|uniref:Ribonuclease n=1 Tax=Peptoniphilus asaccharolyticus DSM 20463 TaxID=573058 RepID=A0A1W1V399_PEPAS|nr:ribonuclease domain-containing protein [Peptoniphilus asaccharolyticus]MBL7576185.1 ribonuclease [Peptoniphilus asaccharolyticus]SMB87763.1 ribonuclease [Peptoniphilus asaccharolyticus DSM 20463]
MKKFLRNITLYFTLLIMLFAVGCGIESNQTDVNTQSSATQKGEERVLYEDEYYYEKEDVAEYIHQYGKLPSNYITKREAKDMNWSVKDNQGLVIGGDKFGNREGKLPEVPGRKYYEADLIEGYSQNRGPVRIIYSDDGFIYYTKDHYETFKRVY